MAYPHDERAALLDVKGVGPTVVDRLEQLGFNSLAQLSEANALDIVTQAAALVNSRPSIRAAGSVPARLVPSMRGGGEPLRQWPRPPQPRTGRCSPAGDQVVSTA